MDLVLQEPKYPRYGGKTLIEFLEDCVKNKHKNYTINRSFLSGVEKMNLKDVVEELKPQKKFHHYRLEWYDTFSATRTDSGESGVCSAKFEPLERYNLFDKVKELMNRNTVRWRDLRLWKVYDDFSEEFCVLDIKILLDSDD